MSEERTGKLDLSAKKRALLQALLREQNAADLAAGKIPRRTDPGPAPLSFAQERLWFLDQYYPGSAIYNMPIVYPLYGPMSAVLVEASLNEVVRRHEILRTTFTAIDGRPVQVVAPKLELKLVHADLLTMPEDQRSLAMGQLIAKETNQPFDLAKGPLLRAALVRVAEQGYYLVLDMHHIISDAWSLGDVQAYIVARLTHDKIAEKAVVARLGMVAQIDGALPEAYSAMSGKVVSRHWFSWPGAALALCFRQLENEASDS